MLHLQLRKENVLVGVPGSRNSFKGCGVGAKQGARKPPISFGSRVRRNITSATAAAVFTAFTFMVPLTGCHEEHTQKGGVVMVGQKRITAADDLFKAKDQEKFMKDFVQANSFDNCKALISAVLADERFNSDQKWLVLESVYGKFQVQTLDYALQALKDPKYRTTKPLSKIDMDNALVLSEVLAYSETHLKKFAEYLSSGDVGMTVVDLTLNKDLPHVGAYFSASLAFRPSITDVDEAFKIAESIMRDLQYNTFTTMFAAIGLLRIDYARAVPAINDVRLHTLNPVKDEILQGILEEYRQTERVKGLLDDYGNKVIIPLKPVNEKEADQLRKGTKPK